MVLIVKQNRGFCGYFFFISLKKTICLDFIGEVKICPSGASNIATS